MVPRSRTHSHSVPNKAPVLVDPKSVQALVDELRTLVGSDTSTLLLLDETGSVLEPAASAGLGRRWRGATHVPVGSGFAGRVAATGEPVLLTDINEHTVLNPILRDFGLRQLYGVPVVGTGGILGVLHAGWRRPQALTRTALECVERAATEVGRRLSARVEDDAHVAALALQRSLLPGAPPSIDGLEIAVRYLPADGDLGGDWYDIFQLPSGKVGIVMGDVEGHGLRSAVAMGRMRSALRAYALDYDDPAQVVQRLDRKMSHFEPGLTATVVYAVTEAPFHTITISSGGHPPPLLVQPSSEVALPLDLPIDPLLGLDPGRPRTASTVTWPSRASFALYTDGLVERRKGSRKQEDPDLERLSLVRRVFAAADNAETACTRIIAEGLGDDNVADDVALAVVRRTQ